MLDSGGTGGTARWSAPELGSLGELSEDKRVAVRNSPKVTYVT